MPYQRSNKLPAMIVQAIKLYAGKHPWLFAALAAVLAFSVLGTAWMVVSCATGSSCRSSCGKRAAQIEANADADRPCRWSSSRGE